MDLCLLIHSPSPTPSNHAPVITPQPPLVDIVLPSEPGPTVIPDPVILPGLSPPAKSSPPLSAPFITQPEQLARPLTTIPPIPSSLNSVSTLSTRVFVDTGGATSFAGRHPLKDVQEPRFRVRGSKTDAAKLHEAVKVAERAEKATNLKDGVDAIVKSRDSEIKELSERLCVTEKTIRTLVNGETHYKKRREPNTFNALVHMASNEMNSGNVGLTLPLWQAH